MLLTILFVIGISVEAITGAIAAGRKDMDFFGVILIACITGLGGGTVRDVVLDLHPLTWVEHPAYLAATILSASITIIFAPALLRMMKVFLVLDALGLATFVVLGAQKAYVNGLAPSLIVISGVLTGISGGMLRDVLCNDIPLVLRREIYALIALAGAFFYWLLREMGINEHLVVFLIMTFIFSTRVIAIYYHVEMGKFSYQKSLKKSARRYRRR